MITILLYYKKISQSFYTLVGRSIMLPLYVQSSPIFRKLLTNYKNFKIMFLFNLQPCKFTEIEM